CNMLQCKGYQHRKIVDRRIRAEVDTLRNQRRDLSRSIIYLIQIFGFNSYVLGQVIPRKGIVTISLSVGMIGKFPININRIKNDFLRIDSLLLQKLSY